jgi:hypothetical protein
MSQVLTSTTVATYLDQLPYRRCIARGSERAKEYLEAPDQFYAQSKLYKLIRCPECSLAWLEDPPTPEELREHYGPDHGAFIRKATEKRSEKHWQGSLARVRKYKEGGTLLDLGCGAGSFMKSVQNPSWTLYEIEMSGESAMLAQSRTGATV